MDLKQFIKLLKEVGPDDPQIQETIKQSSDPVFIRQAKVAISMMEAGV